MLFWLSVATAGESITAYHARAVATTLRLQNEMVEIVSGQMPQSPDGLEEFRLAMRSAAEAYTLEAKALGAFEGDHQLEDALKLASTQLVALVDGDLKEFYQLTTKPEARTEDVARAQVVFTAINTHAHDTDAAMFAADEAFSARHGMKLIKQTASPNLELGPEFRWSTPLPTGITLTPSWLAGRTVVYRNGLLHDVNDVVEALNTLLPALGGEQMRQARETASAAVAKAALRTADRGPWLDDASLYAATVAFEDAASILVDRQSGRLIELSARGFRLQKDVDDYNDTITAMNTSFSDGMTVWHQADDGFDARWHLDEYAAWSAEMQAWQAARAASRPEKHGSPSATPAP